MTSANAGQVLYMRIGAPGRLNLSVSYAKRRTTLVAPGGMVDAVVMLAPIVDSAFRSFFFLEGGFWLKVGGCARNLVAPYPRRTLVIEACEVEPPGQGTFTRFLDELQARWRGPVGFDTVVNERLDAFLRRRGAVQIGDCADNLILYPSVRA